TTDGQADPLCATGTATVTVTFVNHAPVPTTVTWSPTVDPIKVNTATTATGTFTDVDAGDTHTARWNWGDGTTSSGTNLVEPGGSPGTVTGSHTYAAAGVYTVTLTITDAAGAAGTLTYKSVNVYNTTSTISGSGQINSPARSYPANLTLAGTATFSSISVKYATGATVPSGPTSFSYSAATLTFAASTFKWLVTTGGKAWYKGTGTVTINGSSQSCSFLVAAVDGPTMTTDYFRIKIWTASGTIYDDMRGAADEAVATIAATTGPGSITVK